MSEPKEPAEKSDGLRCSALSAMVLVFKPELTHSVWQDAYISDDSGNRLPRDELIEKLKQGVMDGDWVGWRLMQIEEEVIGNVD